MTNLEQQQYVDISALPLTIHCHNNKHQQHQHSLREYHNIPPCLQLYHLFLASDERQSIAGAVRRCPPVSLFQREQVISPPNRSHSRRVRWIQGTQVFDYRHIIE